MWRWQCMHRPASELGSATKSILRSMTRYSKSSDFTARVIGFKGGDNNAYNSPSVWRGTALGPRCFPVLPLLTPHSGVGARDRNGSEILDDARGGRLLMG